MNHTTAYEFSYTRKKLRKLVCTMCVDSEQDAGKCARKFVARAAPNTDLAQRAAAVPATQGNDQSIAARQWYHPASCSTEGHARTRIQNSANG